MNTIQKLSCILIAAIASANAMAQSMNTAPEKTIEWSTTTETIGENLSRIVFTGKIADGWHTYDTDSDMYPTAVEFSELNGCSVARELYAVSEPELYEGAKVFFNEIKMAVDISTDGENPKDIGTLYLEDLEIYVNLDVAEKLGIEIPSDIIERATYIIGNGTQIDS